MFGGTSTKNKKEGFDSYPNDKLTTGTLGIQSVFSKTMPNMIPTTDMKMPLDKLTQTINTRPSKAPSMLYNYRLANISIKNPPTATSATVSAAASAAGASAAGVSQKSFAQRQAACENTSNGDQFDHLVNLSGSQDPNSNMRCGWVYNNKTPSAGRGAYGTQDGAFNTSATGTWMWDLNAAKQKYHKSICDQVTNCQDIDASIYGSRCGWDKQGGKAIPIMNGRVAYPDNPVMSCPPTNLVTSGKSCPPVSVSPSTPAGVCSPLPNGRLSRNCLIQKTKDAGCSDEGTLAAALSKGSDTNYIDQLKQSKAFEIYQQRAIPNLNEVSLKNGNYNTTADALNDFKNINDIAESDLQRGLEYAARDLCFKKGTMEKFDFCSELPDNAPPPFSLDCLQKAFLRGGGQKTGTQYPSAQTIGSWNALPNWKAVNDRVARLISQAKQEGFKGSVKESWADMNAVSAARKRQEEAMVAAYGISLEDKSKIPPPVKSGSAGYSGPLARVNEHCAKDNGWIRDLPGIGVFKAGEHFPADSSYITVPAGLIAYLVNGRGETQTVLGPGEFNFCHRGGFNDGVREITIGMAGPVISAWENNQANLVCPGGGKMTAVNYRYGRWNWAETQKLVYPDQCVGKERCDIGLGNQWGDPLGGVYKQFDAIPVCTASSASYTDNGCWREAPDRALKGLLAIRGASVTSVDQCAQLASANNYKNFGVQYNGECWGGNNDDWDRMGALDEDSCRMGGNYMGAGMTQRVFTHNPTGKPHTAQNVYGNNGTVSCETYCRGVGGGPWNGELPREWNGAKCIGSPSNPDLPCNTTIGFRGGFVCTCEKAGGGWR